MSLLRRGPTYWSQITHEGRRYRRSLETSSIVVARKREAAFRLQLTEGNFATRKTVQTLAEFGVDFLNSLPTRVKPSTFESYARQWKTIVSFDALANASMDAIDTPLIDRFAAHRREQGDAVATVNLTLRVISRAFQLAKEWKRIKECPRMHLLRGENQRDFVISEADEEKIVGRLENRVFGLMVTFMIDTGLRAGEACNLKWSDVEPLVIHIRQGKTAAATRTIPLTTNARTILDQLRSERTHDLPYVFTRINYKKHRQVTTGSISKAFKLAVRAVGISDECVLHSTRHTFLTRLGKAGCSPYELMKLAGHTNIEMSARYCHPDQEQLSKAINKLNGKEHQ